MEWYPWGVEALQRARAEAKPILLSIGYSACHWCHVMAHESFSHPAIARLMNEHFINIKVDREERPDLDRLYQLCHQLLTGRAGGWPLTMFLSPIDQVPFFGGTYFAPGPRERLPGFAELLARVASHYSEASEALKQQNLRLCEVLARLEIAPQKRGTNDEQPLREARARLQSSFDAEYGGFTPAPKFPHPGLIERLLRSWAASASGETPDLMALYMATMTLTRMAEGGLFDHVGGGFARYSVDRFWMIPHFEKMLCDQAQLVWLYAEAAAATAEPLFVRAAGGTADWVIASLQTAAGGFCSSLDADSEGHEGRYYVWDRGQVRALLDPQTFEVLAARFGLDLAPNFAGRYWHLYGRQSIAELARLRAMPEAKLSCVLDEGLATLRAARERRVAPARDDKILPSWNGLMIRALASAARRLGRPDYALCAERALGFIGERMWRNGRLSAAYRHGPGDLCGYLDDYVCVAEGALELLQCRFRIGELGLAIALADAALELFEDRAHGGFYFTANDAPALICRQKPLADASLPAGNGVAARLR